VTFDGNVGQAGGALYLLLGSADIRNATFSQNSSSNGGGAVYTDSGTLTVTESTFSENTTTGTLGGGAIYQVGGSSVLVSLVFAGNTTSGVVSGGALQIDAGSTADVANTVFTGNEAPDDRGGAVFVDDATFTGTHLTMLNNNALDGTAMFVEGTSTATIRNSIAFPHAGPVLAGDGTILVGAALIDGGLPAAAALETGAPPVLDADPQYADADGPDGLPGTVDDDVQIAVASPAADYGLFADLPADAADLDGDGNTTEPLPLDRAGDPRVEDSHRSDGDSGGPDLGAFETPSTLFVTGTADDPPEDAALGEDSGWRMMAVPAPATVGDLSDDIVFGPLGLSGVPPTAMIYQWDDAAPNDTSSFTGDWDGLTSLSDPLPAGRGFILFFFDDQLDPIRPSSPLVFDVPGPRITTDVTVSGLSTTALYHFLGNPYPQAFDIGGLGIGGASGFQAFVWVYDPAAGAYQRIEQGTAGDEVASWQGFTIERSAGSVATSVTFDAASRTSAAPFVGKRTPSESVARIGLRLQATDGGAVTQTDDVLEVSFRQGADDAWDVWDATRPRDVVGTPTLLQLVAKGQRLERWVDKAHESRPLPLRQPVHLPLTVRSTHGAGKYRIGLSTWENVPRGWTVRLVDTQGTPGPSDDVSVRLRPDGEDYTFRLDPAPRSQEKRWTVAESARVTRRGHAAKQEAETEVLSRAFRLVIAPGNSWRRPPQLSASARGRQVVLQWDDGAGPRVEYAMDGQSWAQVEMTSSLKSESRDGRTRLIMDDLAPGRYQFRLRFADPEKRSGVSNIVSVLVMEGPVRIRPPAPNPTTGLSTMDVTVQQSQEVRADVFDLLGRRVARIFAGRIEAGVVQPLTINASALGLASGTYLVRVDGEQFAETVRFAVIK
jgi:predicted outer membrane repeat protein